MPYPNLLEQFALMLNKYPHHTAFSQQGNHWSFEKLAHKTARLFNHIQSIKQDIPYQSHYIIFLEEVPEIVMAMLTVMNLQGVFILISPDTPRNRLTKILKSVHPKYVITSGKHNRLIESLLEEKELKHETILIDQIENSHLSTIPPYTTQNEDQLCYICFTSGSTGEPKSIAGSINALNHFMYWEKNTFEIQPQTRFSQLTHISFDAFLRDIFVPLTTGGTICLPPKKLSILSPSDVMQWLDKEKVEFIHTVPSHLRSLMSDPNLHLHPMSYLKYILLSGERIFPSDIKNWINFLGDGVQLVNLYGPSETTMIKFAYFLTKGDADKDNVPIGKPIEKTKALIINEQGLPCRQGQIGELVIRPPFKLFGYYFQDKNENSPFISNPFNDDPEDIIYKTGDFARLSDDGNYEFICRKDRQLKVRGMRIELGEIEHAIRQYVEVVNAAVIAINTQSNKEVEKIIACVIFKKPTELKNPQLLMQFLQDSLPKYMIPNQVITYDEFPKLANGKVNYKAIEKKVSSMTNEAAEEPKGSIEKELAGIWKQLLKLSKVGRDEDFFELGGHSLLALQLIGQVKKRYGYAMPLNELFSAKTIRLQAALVEKKTPIANKVIVKLDHLPKRNSTCLLIHPITGDLACYRHFTKALEPFCSFYGIQADQDFYQHEVETSIPKIAENYIQTMKKEKFPLPDFIGGWSFGGCIAYEIATQLQKENHRFKQLILIDSSLVHSKQKSIEGLAVIANLCNELLFKLGYKLYQEKWFQWINENPWTSLNEEQLHYYKNLFDLDHPILASTWKSDVKKILKSLEEKMNVSLDVNADYFTKISWNIFIHENALRRYEPANAFEGNVLLFKSAEENRKNHRHQDWEKVIHGKLDAQIVGGDHISMLEPPYISQITQFFRARSIFE